MARATLIGFSAVVMWALLALFTDLSGNASPFLLSALAFSVATAVGLCARLLPGEQVSPVKIPAMAWVVGIAGLFGYHFFYFTALRNVPAVEASLIALSLAAADRSGLGSHAGRKARLASCRRCAAWAGRHSADRHQGCRSGLR